MITAKLTYETSFETEAEYLEFVHSVSEIHRWRYGCLNIAEQSILKCGEYKGAVNTIKIERKPK